MSGAAHYKKRVGRPQGRQDGPPCMKKFCHRKARNGSRHCDMCQQADRLERARVERGIHKVLLCTTCGSLSHRRPLCGCPKCGEDYAPEEPMVTTGGISSSAGWACR